MTTRRQLFSRKEKPRSLSKTGLLLCLLLGGAVMLAPIGGDYIRKGKMKLRDAALTSGLINFDDCVVTADHALDCGGHAAGMPLPVALRQIKDNADEAAVEKRQRLQAESKAHDLALQVERLTAQVKRAQLAGNTGILFPPFNGDIRQTGLVGSSPSDSDLAGSGILPLSVTPPDGD
jgi:hypothetical protein